MTVQTQVRPAVIVAQPTELRQADAGDLVAWERRLMQELRLNIPVPEGMRKDWVRGETISGSGSDWDDCDES